MLNVSSQTTGALPACRARACALSLSCSMPVDIEVRGRGKPTNCTRRSFAFLSFARKSPCRLRRWDSVLHKIPQSAFVTTPTCKYETYARPVSPRTTTTTACFINNLHSRDHSCVESHVYVCSASSHRPANVSYAHARRRAKFLPRWLHAFSHSWRACRVQIGWSIRRSRDAVWVVCNIINIITIYITE